MNLPPLLTPQTWERVKQILIASDLMNYKRGQDVDLAQSRLVLTSPNGTRFIVTVSDAGVLTTNVV